MDCGRFGLFVFFKYEDSRNVVSICFAYSCERSRLEAAFYLFSALIILDLALEELIKQTAMYAYLELNKINHFCAHGT